MKKSIWPLLLAHLVISMPPARAQEATAPAKPLATIDPQARDLLARLNARYKKFRTFQAVVELRASEPMPWTYNRFRVALDGPFRGAVTTATPQTGTQKRVLAEKRVVATDSRFPRRFTLQKLDAGLYTMRLFLKSAGAEGLTIDLLTSDNLAAGLLNSDFQSLSLGTDEIQEGKTLQSVIIRLAGEHGGAALTLWIDPKALILRRTEGTDTYSPDGKAFTFSEIYSEVRFDEPLPPSLISTTPPPGFRIIASFETDTAATTSAPVETLVK